jgi:hypothetical protein
VTALAVGVMAAGFARSQGVAEDSAIVTIRADVDSAVVVIDGKTVGRTPLVHSLPAPGDYAVRILHPDLLNWLTPVMEDSIHLEAGMVLSRFYPLPRRYLVRSEPAGAEVVFGGVAAGLTPLVLEPPGGDTVFQVRKEGYDPAFLRFDGARRGVLVAQLERIPGLNGPMESTVRESPGSSSFPVVLTGTSAIVAGGLAAYFKVKADGRYDEYLSTGDPAQRAETRRLDTLAGISLAASQVLMGLFIYYLLSP